MPLWQVGFLIFILAGLLNTVFMKSAIGGFPRELTRLSIIAGLVLLILGLVRRKKNK